MTNDLFDLSHKIAKNQQFYRVLRKGNIENFTIFLFSFLEDSFLRRRLQKKISFLASVVFEIFALELFCLFFCKNVLQKGTVREALSVALLTKELKFLQSKI